MTADGTLSGAIGKGYLLLVGVGREDTELDARLLADKIAKMRIFSDENGKMNRSVTDIGGAALVVSNFTLFADYRHGNRPAFTLAAPPDRANALYTLFTDLLRQQIGTVMTFTACEVVVTADKNNKVAVFCSCNSVGNTCVLNLIININKVELTVFSGDCLSAHGNSAA